MTCYDEIPNINLDFNDPYMYDPFKSLTNKS